MSAQLLHFGKRLYRSPEQKVPRSNRAITSQSALGALVRVGFAGSVTSFSGEIQTVGEPIPVSPADAEAALGRSIHVGTPFSGFFVYDDSAAPSYSSPELPGIPGYPESGFAVLLPAQRGTVLRGRGRDRKLRGQRGHSSR